MAQTLPKSMRQKNRYLVFKVHTKNNPHRRDVVKSIQKTHLHLYGEAGAGRHDQYVMDYNTDKKMGIVKCRHNYLGETRAALTLLHKIKNTDAFLEIQKITGTLKKARNLIEQA